ncbi:uncharacterized protein [Eurosta solidaginis]|uniref:uncharacterized protein n=1 Tax=Eurosta solidaginis TaxID=178769 RepID=UPI0035317DBC
MRALFIVLLCIGTALAATHVNISIAQHPATNPADVTYVSGMAPAELKAGPARLMSSEERFAKLRAAGDESEAKVQMSGEEKKDIAVASFSGSAESSQVQLQPYAEQSNGFQPQQRFYGRLRQQNRQSQFRQANAQDKQNQEFERYIQNYHNGPSVETVFESSDHSPSSRYTSSSSSSSFSSSTSPKSERLVAYDSKRAQQQQHTFERQVALPTAVTNAQSSVVASEQSQPAADAKTQISSAAVSAPTTVPTQVTMHVQSAQSAPAPSNSISSKPAATNSGSDGGKVGAGASFGASYGSGASGSQGGLTFRGYQPNYNSYAKPEYEQPSYTYNQGDANQFVNEYPPSVEESSNGYNDFYGNQENSYQSNAGYAPMNPVYQRPVVTKTIQIAQPALKAKKFEVRHPAIQKEFYDIEERVVIKPAGTIVVELERPVAKIPKGETVLPLGHPHPAIAAQYNQNSDADIETESSSAGSYNNGVRSPARQIYVQPTRKQPAPVISATQIGSTVTATPANNQNAKRDFVEANLRKQYGEEAKLAANPESSQREQNSRVKDLFIPVESPQSNQRQVSNRNLYAFRREENNYQRPVRVELKSNADIYSAAFSKNDEQSAKNNEPALQSKLNNDGEDDDEYKGEYVTGNFYSSVNKDPKPARLQQAPAMNSERITAEPQTQIIKHEHTINIPPSQHNIYLAPSNFESRALLVQEQRKSASAPKAKQTARLEEETARVQEIKPYLERSRDSVIVYAVPARRPAAAAATQQRYTQNERQQSQYVSPQQQLQRSYAQLRYEPNVDADKDADVDASVEYSAPYSHMRFVPSESARLTADMAYRSQANDDAPQRTLSINYNRGSESYARLVAQNQSEKGNKKSENTVESQVSGKPEMRHIAHIQVQVPHGPQEADEPIRIMSSINTPKTESESKISEKVVSKQDINDQVEQINLQPSAEESTDSAEKEEEAAQSANVAAKPDCAQPAEKVSARYESRQQSAYDNAPYVEQRGDYVEQRDQLKSQRLIDTSNANGNGKDGVQGISSNSQTEVIDANAKDASGAHASPAGSRVIAANPAPSDASATSESFHKRRIVVNHPFQTVREVVEHEPITNYHQIQVHEHASPASAYHSAPYFAPNGALRQFETHGNLVYVLPDAIPVHEDNGETEPSFVQSRQRQ